MKPIFTGVCTAIITPLKRGNVDWVAFGRLINMQIEGGVGAILVLGTTGEAPTTSDVERTAIVNFAVEVIAKRVPLVVGVGGNYPPKIIGYAQEAKDAGADAVLLSSPYYNKTTQAGLVAFFKHIAKAVNIPIIAYNIPGRSGMNIDPATMAQICNIPQVRGVKESSGNIEQIADVIRLCKNTPVYSGDDVCALPAYALGAQGVVSVAANVRPRETAEIFELVKRRQNKMARDLFLEELPFYKSLFVSVNPIPVKRILSRVGLCSAEVRLPLVTE